MRDDGWRYARNPSACYCERAHIAGDPVVNVYSVLYSAWPQKDDRPIFISTHLSSILAV